MNPIPTIFAQADPDLFNFLHTMRGPDFLLLFGGWFIVTFGGVLVFRWCVRDTPITTILGVICFESLGVARIIDGSAHGMHKWLFLILMMILGGLIFFLRADHFQNTGNSDGGSWWGSSCGSSGCGGGGSGCGGCGGS